MDGNFRIFKFENKNGTVYSLVINCTEDNESFFRKLNSAQANQSCKILKDHTVTPENFELVKENKYGCSVFVKIYCYKSGKTKCRISKGSYKNLIEIDEMIDENFRGSCITQSLSGLHWFKQIHKYKRYYQERLKGKNLTSLMRAMKKVRKRRKRDTKPPIHG